MIPGLFRKVRRHRERIERGRRDRERSIGEYLALAGAVGWLVVVPALLGAWLGRVLDRALGTGITFGAALLVVGVALGCYLAWTTLAREWRRR